MLKSWICEKKFKEIAQELKILPNTEEARLYANHLERLKDAYNKEFLKALNRREPRIGIGAGKKFDEIMLDDKRGHGWI